MMLTAPVAEAGPFAITPERFEAEFVRAARPVVFRSLVAHCGARKWEFPRIDKHLPKRVIEGCGASSADGFSVHPVSLSPEEMVRRLADDREPQRSTADWFFDVPAQLPEIAGEVPPPNVYRGALRYYVLIGRNTWTRGHYHSYDHAMICQIHGRKRIVLHPPRDSSRLYPYPRRGRSSQHEHSRVDFLTPDFAKFPKLAGTHRLDATLDAGDALFIPVHWWHAVHGNGPVMSTSVLWSARLRDYSFSRPGLIALACLFRARIPEASRLLRILGREQQRSAVS